MTRLLPLFLGLVSVAHAEANSPTVSAVAITSNPGTDNTYAAGDAITVGVTFSEAVTVTGAPRITLDIGGTERTAEYSGAGTAAGQLLFSYTVQPVDQDDDGVAVKENGLALNGGTVRSTDDSANAKLTHTAMTFANQPIDNDITPVSNIGQSNVTNDITISVTQSAIASFTLGSVSGQDYTLRTIVLDVKTPSSLLDVTFEVVPVDLSENLMAGQGRS